MSRAKSTARLAAKVSRVKTKSGIGICSAKAATTYPCSFRTTTPIPAALKSSKIAPSKFNFNKPASGGFHRGFCVWTFLLGQRRACWNSCRWCRVTQAILFNGQTPSPTCNLFRRLQILQHVIANTSTFSEEQNTSSSKSRNELALENLDGTDVKQESHTEQIS